MAERGDADGDGLLEYVDHGATALSNQGWKDSPDSIQWADGRLAEAADRAVRGAGVRATRPRCAAPRCWTAYGRDGGDRWRELGGPTAQRFRERFWVD